jgi:dihydrofolate reductase
VSGVTCGVSISVDGYVAGPNQSLDNPIGESGDRLHRWMFEQAGRNQPEIQALTAPGVFIMGRNMFGPGRGRWDLAWNGWWGPDPPYHAPVFVLTHHEREPVAMEGGTTFTFVTGGVEAALERARRAAGGKDVSVAGGASTVNQFLAAGLIDELWLHIAPITLGGGARLFEGVGPLALEPVEVRGTDMVSHIRYRVAR